GFRTFAANRFQGLGEFGLALDGADARRFAVGEKGPSRIGIEAEEIALLADVIGDARRDRIALPRERDRWLERAFQRAAAVINDEPRPGLDRAGNGDRVRRMALDRLDSVTCVPFRRRRHRRAPRAVIGDDLGRAPKRDLRETIAADAGRTGFDDALHRACRDRGVDGVAAVAQRLDGRKRREGMRGRRHTPSADGRRSSWKLEISHVADLSPRMVHETPAMRRAPRSAPYTQSRG